MIRLRFAWLLLLLPASALAETPLTADAVLQSARAHYPKIMEALARQRETEGAVQEARGAFDATIEQDVSNRLSGFYDGRQLDTRIVKPIPFMNSQIYGGYRVSEGDFPIYEDILFTNEQGEVSLGAQFSLLRDRLIDSRRARVNQAELDREIAEIDVLMEQVAVQQEALSRYWRWVASGRQIDILEGILALMQERQEALQIRADRGDVAKIFLTENLQNIRRRQSQIVLQRQQWQEDANRLSLFFRDDEGAPRVPSITQLPDAFPGTNHDTTLADESGWREMIDEHPLLQRIGREVGKEEQTLALGENLLLPRADVVMEVSNDLGPDGDAAGADRAATESIVKLNISIPLETNQAEGTIRRAKAKMKQLDFQKQLQEDQLRMRLNNIMVRLNNAAENIGLTQEEMALARRMVKAERERFRKGDSDFFLINMREEMLANASLSNILANARYQQACAELFMFTLNEAQPCSP